MLALHSVKGHLCPPTLPQEETPVARREDLPTGHVTCVQASAKRANSGTRDVHGRTCGSPAGMTTPPLLLKQRRIYPLLHSPFLWLLASGPPLGPVAPPAAVSTDAAADLASSHQSSIRMEIPTILPANLF